MAATEKVWVNDSPPQFSAGDANGFKNENNTLILTSGSSLNVLDNTQTSKAVSVYSSGSYFYTDSGAPSAYALSPVGSKVTPPEYFEGMHISFVPENSNIGHSTINIGTLGVRNLLLPNGDSTGVNSIRAGEYISAYYESGDDFRIIGRFEQIAGGFTSEIRPWYNSVAPGGWINLVSGTIGNSASGATLLANEEARSLYEILYNNVLDAWAPVTGGRSGDANVDFDSNKELSLPRVQSRSLGASGQGIGLTDHILGSYVGDESVTLTEAQLAPHTHGINPSVVHSTQVEGIEIGPPPFAIVQHTNVSVTESSGLGEAHPNIQPTFFTNFIIKL